MQNLFDQVSQNINEISWRIVGLLFLFTWALSAIEKFVSIEVPSWFMEQFAPTVLGRIPFAVSIAFNTIRILEATAAILFLWAMLSLQPLAQNAIFRTALVLSEFIFIMLAFGLRISFKYTDAAFLFFYAIATFVIARSCFMIRSSKEL